MPLYFKRYWDECRIDEYDAWGTSLWYFETDERGEILRQLELYDSGHVLKYDSQHLADNYGMLGVHELELDDFKSYAITDEEFESAWAIYAAINRT